MSDDSTEDLDNLIDEELIEYAETSQAKGSAIDLTGDAETQARATIPLADATINILRKHFIHSKESMKRANHGSAFTHCPASIPIAEEYTRLRALLSEHACLELQKDIIARIRQFEIFIRNLKKLVQEETASWQAINHPAGDGLLEDHQTNLTALSSICDEFRMHLNHWICIKHRVQSNRWLRAALPSYLRVIYQVCRRFVKLQETAFWWTEKLLKTGMQVFAYVDRRSLTYNDVFSIVRGIEEYNTLIQLVRCNTHEMKLSSHSLYGDEERSRSSHSYLVQSCQFTAVDSSTTKPLHFTRLLNSLAQEWAKSAVAITRHFFDSQPLLLESMQSSRCLHVDGLSTSHTEFVTASVSQSKQYSNSPQLTTSDYHSESLGRRELTTTVDITTGASPLLDFGKKEKEYITKVIQITCQRTSLIRKSKHTPQSLTPSLSRKSDSFSRGSEAAILEEKSSESFSRNDPKRKSVSWGDSHDMSVCKQLIAKYNDALWKAFGEMLEDSLNHGMSWAKQSEQKNYVGCLDLCTSGALQIFIQSVSHACGKGYFTKQGSQQVAQVLRRIKARANLVLCDVAISRCLSSMQGAKAIEVIPLHDDRKSTRTAMLLRNAIILARGQLAGTPVRADSFTISKGSPVHHVYSDYRIRSNVIGRLATVICLAEEWCKGKAFQFLRSYKVAPFVLIIHSDLMILHKELTMALRLFCDDMFLVQMAAIQAQLDSLKKFQVDMKHRLVEKALDLTHKILAMEMPSARTWKRLSSDQELETQSYAENVVDNVLAPVIDGAKHLCTEDQVLAVETFIDAICKTWLEYLLKHKIKFSVRGAAQLRKDFAYLEDFIEVHFNDESLKLQIMRCTQVRRFTSVIWLLQDQPTTGENRSLSSRNRIAPMELLDKGQEHYEQLEDKAQWTALRAGTPIGRTLFPCLPLSATEGC
ncbi:uncharacterized protein [Watersipora subatra]|uniref:uncharacterized protein n=1 Tax=Watersipora subatra TaxID=2589382 RepID=UPI00355BBA66